MKGKNSLMLTLEFGWLDLEVSVSPAGTASLGFLWLEKEKKNIVRPNQKEESDQHSVDYIKLQR